MFSNLKGWEWLIIVALILLLFGAKRLPDAARGLGRSLRIFKAETKGLADSSDSSKISVEEEVFIEPEKKSVTASEKSTRPIDSPIVESEER